MTAKAESDNGEVGGIRGKMRFDPFITASGTMRQVHSFNGANPPGAAPGTVLVTASGTTNPYVKAAVLLAQWAMGSGAHCDSAVAGNSVIEFDPAGPKSVNSTSGAIYQPGIQTSFAPLSTTCIERTSMPSLTIRGSYDLMSQLQAYDDSIICEAHGTVNPVDSGTILAGCNKPSYEP